MTIHQLIPIHSADADAPRFCHACAHRVDVRIAFLGTERRCGHPAVCDPVMGQPLARCDDLRTRAGTCGPMARLYQAARTTTPKAQDDFATVTAPVPLRTRLWDAFGQHIAAART